MLKTSCINPEIMKTLSLCGHGDKILIADGNYPLDSKTGDSKKVYLGVASGIPTVTQVLEALLGGINVEKAEVMEPGDGSRPEIFSEFEKLLPGMTLEGIDRFEFYDACSEPAVRLSISTGEKRIFANILLTIGVA
ncbi:RbsD/FucU family protein [Marasmitruncus massiliensis]|jgi:L-fucose mutarotase|uniref:RbsD/FucU family protein n=1 Tax=Marasmitruncus massiliensis TaxID=1944642 RepID=UPI000C7C2163|nr:RbsD/FucU family protein [Marasmitruncus massiliensis]MBE6907317.1 RbsD or FucU transport [Oscillospiraceae bacterium]